MNEKTALEQLEYWIEQYYLINGTPTLDDIKGQINLLKDYEREQLHIANVSFSIFDEVYMDSPFGRYTGIVKDVKDGKMTIESHSPTGKGMMLTDYDVEGTEWKKY